ncbi:MAG: hypothetical protein NUW02_00960 [Candidatus Campbellbacteria bacterium]|nr:hypothetical protein [Candidatus Campbellbacteria bacterium]
MENVLLDVGLSLLKILYMMTASLLLTVMVKIIIWVWRKATPNSRDRGLDMLKYLSLVDVWFILFLILYLAKSMAEILEDVAKM